MKHWVEEAVVVPSPAELNIPSKLKKTFTLFYFSIQKTIICSFLPGFQWKTFPSCKKRVFFKPSWICWHSFLFNSLLEDERLKSWLPVDATPNEEIDKEPRRRTEGTLTRWNLHLISLSPRLFIRSSHTHTHTEIRIETLIHQSTPYPRVPSVPVLLSSSMLSPKVVGLCLMRACRLIYSAAGRQEMDVREAVCFKTPSVLFLTGSRYSGWGSRSM